MSQLSIPLNPVASPTNQFLAPRIQAPSQQSAANLAALSSSLAQIAPELKSIFMRRHGADVEGSQARARADFQNRRFANLKALKEAVDAGQIDEADNPWYITQLKQDVAANEAAQKVSEMQVAWEDSPVRFSDDPKEVEAWANQQLTGITDIRDAYVAEATFPVLRQGIGQLLSRHMDVRRQERAEERITSFQQRVSTVLQGQDQQANAAELNRLIADARHTMPGAQVNELVLRAAGQTAEATGDEGVLAALSLVPNHGAGGTLADTPEVKALQQQLPLMRLRRSMQIDEYLQHQQKQQAEQRKSAMLEGLMKDSGFQPWKIRVTPELAAKWGVSFEDTIELNEKAIRYGDLLADQGDKQAARMDKAKDRQAEQLRGDIEARIARGTVKITDPEVLDVKARIAELSPNQVGQLDRYLADRHDQDQWRERIFARESDPAAYNDLWTLAKTGMLTPADLIPQAEKLSHDDWTRLYHEAIKPETSGVKLSDFPMSKYDDLLTSMVVWPKTQEGFGTTAAEAAKDPFVAGSIARAQTKFAEVAQGLLSSPEFTKLPRDEQTARLHKAMDSIAKEFGGVTEAEYQKAISDKKAKETQAAKEAEAKIKEPTAEVDADFTIRLSNGKQLRPDTKLTPGERDLVRSVTDKGDPNSIENIYRYPDRGGLMATFRSDWFGPNSAWNNLTASYNTSRPLMYLRAYVQNARLLGGGGYQSRKSMQVAEDFWTKSGSHIVQGGFWDHAERNASILMPGQRRELADIREEIGRTWITDANKNELMRLAVKINAQKQSGSEVDPKEMGRLNELDQNFRLYDFLSVTAGVNDEQVKNDWTLLYKYPAIGDESEIQNLIPLIHAKVPEGEREAVLEAQRLMLARLKATLRSGRHLP